MRCLSRCVHVVIISATLSSEKALYTGGAHRTSGWGCAAVANPPAARSSSAATRTQCTLHRAHAYVRSSYELGVAPAAEGAVLQVLNKRHGSGCVCTACSGHIHAWHRARQQTGACLPTAGKLQAAQQAVPECMWKDAATSKAVSCGALQDSGTRLGKCTPLSTQGHSTLCTSVLGDHT